LLLLRQLLPSWFFDTPVAPASVGLTRALASAAIGASHVVSVPEWVDFLRPFASARWNLSQYKCSEALVALKSVDASQHQTAWVCCEMAKAYAEMGEYAMAEQYFGLSQKHSPWRIESMEVYSTVLWHLKKDKKLSDLAHHLVQLDKLAPQTWCVVGNCFSLLKEHDSALRFFQRAIQVDPLFVYAYTLCGHEFVANDDLDQASSFFRNAIRRDPRHYNAWYGLGMIFFRTQRLELAEYHFAQALKINPRSSALHTYLGMVKSKLHGFDQAIRCLDVALSCNPKNLLARLQKAQVLINKGDVEAGRAMVDEMLQSSPREAFLHFLKATACAKLGDRESALMHYTTAFDLDTRNGPLIKARIERLYTNPVVGAEKPIDNDAALEEDFDVVG
jgi:anaphase-promoting complex subunit 3